jgi:3-deoxy-D-manno-octulosonic-acid transferase
MRWLFDALYVLALVALSPWLIYRALRTGRYRQGLRDKLCGLARRLPPGAVWFHGVSVGEIHLLRQVVAAFCQRHPGQRCVISTTTDTGLEEAQRSFPDLEVFAFPFDFSWAVGRTLRQVQPSLVVLAEGELWPNFLLAARRQGVPVAVINGRMSPGSWRRYARLGRQVRWLFRSIDLFLMQNEEYATAVRALGAPAGRVGVTGSVKFDGVSSDRQNARTQRLRELFGVTANDLVLVAGSTQAPEEEIVLGIYQRVQIAHANLRLFLVPRQRDRFDEVARLLQRSGLPFVRRSALSAAGGFAGSARVVLVDTIGELGALWGLADVAFVGGSLDGHRGGQNMIEPAAYGVAVTFGPHVWNFKDIATRLVECGGARQVDDAAELESVLGRLLADEAQRRQMGMAGRDFVQRQQGATEQTVTLLGQLLAERAKQSRAA